MSCRGIELGRSSDGKPPLLWIIGYGNPQRRDDGIGPYVVSTLDSALKERDGIHILACHQLGPELVEELSQVDLVLMVDASVQEIPGGWEWRKVEPDLGQRHYLSHHVKPAFFLGLIQSVYHRCPLTWMVSVQGDDFDLGEGLTPAAEKRAIEAVNEIVKFVDECHLILDRFPPEHRPLPARTEEVVGLPLHRGANLVKISSD